MPYSFNTQTYAESYTENFGPPTTKFYSVNGQASDPVHFSLLRNESTYFKDFAGDKTKIPTTGPVSHYNIIISFIYTTFILKMPYIENLTPEMLDNILGALDLCHFYKFQRCGAQIVQILSQIPPTHYQTIENGAIRVLNATHIYSIPGIYSNLFREIKYNPSQHLHENNIHLMNKISFIQLLSDNTINVSEFQLIQWAIDYLQKHLFPTNLSEVDGQLLLNSTFYYEGKPLMADYYEAITLPTDDQIHTYLLMNFSETAFDIRYENMVNTLHINIINNENLIERIIKALRFRTATISSLFTLDMDLIMPFMSVLNTTVGTIIYKNLAYTLAKAPTLRNPRTFAISRTPLPENTQYVLNPQATRYGSVKIAIAGKSKILLQVTHPIIVHKMKITYQEVEQSLSQPIGNHKITIEERQSKQSYFASHTENKVDPACIEVTFLNSYTLETNTLYQITPILNTNIYPCHVNFFLHFFNENPPSPDHLVSIPLEVL
jgi:hypothetical protein